MDQSCQKVFSLDRTWWLNFYFFDSTYFIFIHQGVIFNSFTPEANCSFPNNSKYDLYIGIRILSGQKLQKCFGLEISLNSTSSFRKNYSCETFYQVLNLRFHTTTGLLLWRISGFIPYIGLNSSIKMSIDNFFPQKRVFFKSIVVCSIYHFCAVLTENIAERLRLLFLPASWNCPWRADLFAQPLVPWLKQLCGRQCVKETKNAGFLSRCPPNFFTYIQILLNRF